MCVLERDSVCMCVCMYVLFNQTGLSRQIYFDMTTSDSQRPPQTTTANYIPLRITADHQRSTTDHHRSVREFDFPLLQRSCYLGLSGSASPPIFSHSSFHPCPSFTLSPSLSFSFNLSPSLSLFNTA